MATARIRLDAIGGKRVLAALRGIRTALQQTNKTGRDESTRSRRQALGDAAARAGADENAAKRGETATRRAEVRKRREWKMSLRERQRLYQEELHAARRNIQRQAIVERARRQAERDINGPERRPGRLRGMLRAGGAALAGGAMGGATALHGVTQGLQGTMGIRSQQEVIGSAVDLRQDFIRGARAGGMTELGDIQRLLERSTNIAREAGVSPEEMLRSQLVGQEAFSSISTAVRGGDQGMADYEANLAFLARVARATGSSMEEVTGAAGEFQRQFGLDAEGMRDAMAIVTQGALDGSLTMEDFAQRFPAAIANFQAARGTSGIEALREFQAIAQGLRASGVDPHVAKTLQENLMANLSNRRVQTRLRRMGINVRDEETGNVRSIADITAQAADSERAGNLGNLIAALGNQEAANALSMLRQQELRARGGQDGALTMEERVNVSREGGMELFDDTLRLLNQDASGDVIRQRVDREARLIAESDELIAAFSRLTGILTQLEDDHPMLSNVGLPVLQGVGTGAGLAALGSRLFGGGAAATSATAAGAGGGGALATGGGSVAGAGALPIAAAVAGGLAIAGAVTAAISATGMFSTQRFGEEPGEIVEVSLLDQIAEVPERAESAFAGGIWESIKNAVTGPAQADDMDTMLARQEAYRQERREEFMRLHPETVNALATAVQGNQEPGAGRRGDGSPGR